MDLHDIGALISVIGLLTQIGGNLLLVGLFAALGRGQRRQPYFREWTYGWAWLLAGLLGVLVQYAIPGFSDHPLALRGANVLYQAGKLLFVVHLVGGTLHYVRGTRPTVFRRRAGPLAVVYAIVTASLPGMLLNGVVLLQTPLMAGPFLLCAWLLLRVAAPRRSFGTRATGAVSMAIAGLWVLYAAAYLSLGLPPNLDSDGPAAFLLRYNSYVDLLLQMLLGFGMVVVLLEDAKREADDARAQLSIAHDRLKRASLYDALTGALNRRAFEDGVGLETVAARGTALVLDMDNLKVVNDTHGHRAGDDLLCRLVDALRASMRPEDRLYRWGGDEFVVLAPNAPAEALGPRIRAAVERANAEYAPDSPLRLQLSLGASSFSSPQEIGAAIERADRAMYEDKAHHRRSSRTAQPAL